MLQLAIWLISMALTFIQPAPAVSCEATVLIGGHSYSAPAFTEATLTSTQPLTTGDQVIVTDVLITPGNGRIWFHSDTDRWLEAYTGYQTGISPVIIPDGTCYGQLPLSFDLE